MKLSDPRAIRARKMISALAVAWLLNKNGNINHAVHAILKALAKLASVSKIELPPTSVLYAGIARRALPFASAENLSSFPFAHVIRVL